MNLQSAHILVVDDDGRLRDLLKTYLSDNFFRVTTADSVATARAKMANNEFDLVILDRMMPGESGSEFASALRRTNEIPILMLTAMAETNDRIFGLEAGVDDYLVKPFEPRELLLRINWQKYQYWGKIWTNGHRSTGILFCYFAYRNFEKL